MSGINLKHQKMQYISELIPCWVFSNRRFFLVILPRLTGFYCRSFTTSLHSHTIDHQGRSLYTEQCGSTIAPYHYIQCKPTEGINCRWSTKLPIWNYSHFHNGGKTLQYHHQYDRILTEILTFSMYLQGLRYPTQARFMTMVVGCLQSWFQLPYLTSSLPLNVAKFVSSTTPLPY